MSNNGNSLSKIEHIVVLMLENRSFDNLLENAGKALDPGDAENSYRVAPRWLPSVLEMALKSETTRGA
jgi:hypothetical protein